MLWIGFALAVLAFVTYFSLFVEFPLTRNVPWVNLLLFGLAAVLLVLGMGRAVRQPELYRGKIFGSVFAGLSVLIFASFIFTIFVAARRLPASASAPHVGVNAPDFTLSNTKGEPVSLAALLTQPLHGVRPTGVMLVFYRGYW